MLLDYKNLGIEYCIRNSKWIKLVKIICQTNNSLTFEYNNNLYTLILSDHVYSTAAVKSYFVIKVFKNKELLITKIDINNMHTVVGLINILISRILVYGL